VLVDVKPYKRGLLASNIDYMHNDMVKCWQCVGKHSCSPDSLPSLECIQVGCVCVNCSFDQALWTTQNIDCQFEDWKVFRQEMEAQFFFHCGTVLLNKALKVEEYRR
jgi:hypothetical protein